MRRAFGVVLLLALVGCERPRVVGVGEGSLELPDSLQFPATALGYSRVAVLPITNRTRVPVTLTPSTTAPFSVRNEVTVGGGTEERLEVTFSPTEAGLSDGVLELGGATVVLRGEGVEQQACGAAGPCEVVRFDADQLRCVREAAEEGTACSDVAACVDSGSCSSGVCIGRAALCDDANPCTVDSCAVGSGCQHTTLQCTAPTEPCLAARCDPALGCTVGPVADGTPCGDVSCELANVCLAGACRAVTPPEGFTCAEASLCQGAGACHQRSCVRPAPEPLEARWSYVATGRWLRFDGLHDDAGNWFWVECGSRCEAVSFTATGFERFRRDLGPTTASGSGQVLAGAFFIVSANGLHAIDQLTGQEAWSTLSGELVELMAEDGSGQAWAVSHTTANGWSLVRFSVSSGAVLGRVSLPGRTRALLLDSAHRAHVVSTLSTTSASTYLRVDANGTTSGPVTIGEETPLYVDGERVVWSDDSERNTFDGQVVVPPGQQLPRASGGLASDGARWRLAWDGALRPPRLRVDRRDARGAVTTLLDDASDGSQSAFLTRNGSALIVSSWDRARAQLVPAAGGAVERCELNESGGATVYGAALAGFNGKWLALSPSDIDILDHVPTQRLLFFEVPDLGLAATGWVNAHGTPQGSRRPR
ncbi:MAG: hypothetical protein QM817_31630 [Archangium sp.]